MSAPAPLASASTSAPATRRYHAELEVAESIATLATRARALLAAMNDVAPASEDPQVEAARVLARSRSRALDRLESVFGQHLTPFIYEYAYMCSCA